ncbi:CDP-diacylglycerol--serine O-phosphatidyltransferase [Lysobacter enzymogenes]|uniref:CDP-diacylglycerol--serine O-phosphatidyltransferase n=1 Tax=Lysobacter enzymogenes TaxID=69 RepID=A0A3N2RJU0_LYSEN|nr:CDP-diacylglycerol--serine O-phosphatidyltransferase [Lysobacter enzymogenes]ROU07669.1 CDP-diacylglycerol--serine O-phosphatidyltransferase [Lysobacter enzymogenes]
MEPQPTPRPRGRGIYLLPNLFTTGGMFAGFYAIIAATQGRFDEACVAIFVAAILDGVDGRVARLTNTQSEFGVQYDSLADLISFGLAPALVMYHWALEATKLDGVIPGKIGWVGAFLYAACAALRLARFNSQVGQVDKRWFIGLASPAAAGLVASFVWTCHSFDLSGEELRYAALAVTVLAGLLMVSRVRYVSFKGSGPRNDRVPFLAILVVVAVLVAIAIDPPRVLLAIFAPYALSGPVQALWRRLRRAPETPSPPAGGAGAA